MRLRNKANDPLEEGSEGALLLLIGKGSIGDFKQGWQQVLTKLTIDLIGQAVIARGRAPSSGVESQIQLLARKEATDVGTLC
jgi:hypothetical protein